MKKHLQFLLFCKGLAGRQKTFVGYERLADRIRETVSLGARALLSSLRACAKLLSGVHKTPCGHTQKVIIACAK